MTSPIASMAVLVTANVAPAMKSMDQMGNKVKDVGQTSQKEGAKTEGFMKRWAGSFAAIGAAATGALYMVVKASPLLSGAMQEAQDAMSLLFMTIGDALEPIIRPFVDLLWGLADIILDMPAPLGALTAGLIAFGSAVAAALTGLALLPKILHSIGLASGAAASSTLVLAAQFAWLAVGAGLVAAALYHISGEPTVAIVGALTTIGIGASILFHQPVIFAVTSIISAFVMLAGEVGPMEAAVSGAFLTIGIGATALMGHPIIAAITGVIGVFTLVMRATGDLETAIIASFAAIGVAAAILMANPVIAAISLVLAALAWLEAKGAEVGETFKGMGLPSAEEAAPAVPWPEEAQEEIRRRTQVYQYGGYVPHTGPAFLHAGEYVVPRGQSMGAVAPAGRVYRVDYHPTIEIVATLRDHYDVEALKRDLDDLYKREMERVV